MVEIVTVIFLTPTGCVWCGQQERADSHWTLGRSDSGWHKKDHWVWFCSKYFCEQIQPLTLYHELDQWVFTEHEALICGHFGADLCREQSGRKGAFRWEQVGAGMGSDSRARFGSEVSSRGGGTTRSCWKQKVELKLFDTFCKVPWNPQFLGYLSTVAKLNSKVRATHTWRNDTSLFSNSSIMAFSLIRFYAWSFHPLKVIECWLSMPSDL